MQLAFSTNAYLNHSFADAVPRLAEHRLSRRRDHGRRAARLAGVPARRAEAGDPRRAGEEQPRDLEHQRVHDARGQRPPAEVLAPVVDRAGPATTASVRIDHTKRALTLAKELGAKCITTEPGGPVEGRPWGECLKLFVEMLKPVVEHAEKEGVLLLVEPEPDLLIETADQYLEFASKISVAGPRAELRHRPLLLREGRAGPTRPPAGEATSATSTWRTSPRRGCTTT